jgi:hypothetical protein
MFGFASFAQTPFSSLANTIILLEIQENINMNSPSSDVFNFNPSLTENIVMDDIDATAGDFFGLINEFVTIADTSTQASNFLQDITENSNINN